MRIVRACIQEGLHYWLILVYSILDVWLQPNTAGGEEVEDKIHFALSHYFGSWVGIVVFVCLLAADGSDCAVPEAIRALRLANRDLVIGKLRILLERR